MDAAVTVLLTGRVGLFVRLPGLPGSRPALLDALHTYADRLGEEPGTELFIVSLDPADPAALAQYAAAVSTPGNALYRQYLTTVQFAARFASSAAQIFTVEDTLRADGLDPSPVSPDHLAIRVSGTAGQFASAFACATLNWKTVTK